jgi:pantoate--beta-alanine ligase
LVEDLAFPIEVVPCPTVWEADGLALSSRNRRLSLEHRVMAPLIHKSLEEARTMLLAGLCGGGGHTTRQDAIHAVPRFSVGVL